MIKKKRKKRLWMGQCTKWACEHHCRHRHALHREKIAREQKCCFTAVLLSVSPADFFVASWISSNIAQRHFF